MSYVEFPCQDQFIELESRYLKTLMTSQLSLPDYFWRRKRRETMELLTRNASKIFQESEPEYNIVDVGTGYGEDLFLLYENLEKKLGSKMRLVGVDGNAEAVDRCNQTAAAKYPPKLMQFVLHDITSNLPFEDHEIDFIYCSEVIEHLVSPETLLSEFRRTLKKNAYLLLTTMNQPNIFELQYWRNLLHLKDRVNHEALMQDYKVFEVNGKPVKVYGHISLRTIAQWESSLKALGFHRVDVGRGAIRYDLPGSLAKNALARKTVDFLEALFDIFPRQITRKLSCQLIGLYQLQK